MLVLGLYLSKNPLQPSEFLIPLIHFAILPFGSIRKETRKVPIYSLPINFFFAQASYFSTTFLSSSARRVNGKSYFSANFLWLFAFWMLIPKTLSLSFLKSGIISRIAQASFVQPGVSSFG